MNRQNRKDCYLNGEHYYDPTAGEVIANVCGDTPGPRVVEGDAWEVWEGTLDLLNLNKLTEEDLIKLCMSATWGPRMGNGRKLDQVVYEDFANGIIVQAANDYRAARRILRDCPGNPESREAIRKLEEFFLSPWYARLTALEGTKLLNMLKEEEIK